MITLMRNGGFPMWFIVAFGLAALVGAIRYALGPDARRLAFAKWMGYATLFSTLTGTFADVAATLYATTELAFKHEPLEGGVQWYELAARGLAESTSPGIMGFTLLSLTALLIAVGKTRPAAVEA